METDVPAPTRAGRTAIVVLGMHRSGTSALAGTLSILGASTPATLMPASKNNRRGFFESVRIKEFNDRLLASAGSRWNDWQKFDEGWHGTTYAAASRRELANLLRMEFGAADFFVIKEPRACRFAPFWLSALRQERIATKIVIPVRNPLEVAHSLCKRSRRRGDGLVPTLKDGLCLWLRHCLDAEADTRGAERTFVHYDNLLSDWRAVARQIASRLDIAFPASLDKAGHEVEAFLTPDLRHHRTRSLPSFLQGRLERFVLDAHEALLNLAHDDGENSRTRAQLDEIRETFDGCCIIHR